MRYVADDRLLNRLELAAVTRMAEAQASRDHEARVASVAYREGVHAATRAVRAHPLPDEDVAAPSPGRDFVLAMSLAALVVAAGALLMPAPLGAGDCMPASAGVAVVP